MPHRLGCLASRNSASIRLRDPNHSHRYLGAKASVTEIVTQILAATAALAQRPCGLRQDWTRSAEAIAATTIRHAKAGNTNRYSLCGISEWVRRIHSATRTQSVDDRARSATSSSRSGAAYDHWCARRRKYQSNGFLPNCDATPWKRLSLMASK